MSVNVYLPSDPSATSRAQARAEDPVAPRVLYFDIDGTLVQPTFGAAKPALAGGRFEDAVRAADFDRIVCVSDGVAMGRALADAGCGDIYSHVFRYCAGTIRDEAWFRENIELVDDPVERGHEIDLAEDWYYIDDYATEYLERACGPLVVQRGFANGRIVACRPRGSGAQTLRWLRSLRPIDASVNYSVGAVAACS